MPSNIAAQGMVRDLVNQFSDPLAFYRELIQNSIDAGANRVDVSLEFVPGPPGAKGMAVVAVEDDGCGMDEKTIDDFLLVLFRSTKEDDLTKIGKFGVGFLSVFALKPELVRVSTAKNLESWRLDFPDWRSYKKFRMPDPRDGTRVELRKRMDHAEYQDLARRSLETIRYWCRHADTRIFFRDAEAGGPALPVTEPFSLAGGEALRYSEEGTEVLMGFAARERRQDANGAWYDADDNPFYGFYNRGLTLKEGHKVFVPGVELKVKSRYLEHTITRDNVMEDENYRKAMEIVKRLAAKELPAKLRAELEKTAAAISRAAAAGDAAQLKALSYEWERRRTFLYFLGESFMAGFRYDFDGWRVVPTYSGTPCTVSELKDAWKKCPRGASFYAGEPACCGAAGPGPASRALTSAGLPVVVSGPDLRVAEFIARVGGPGVFQASAVLVAEPLKDGEAPPELAAFLRTLGTAGAACGRDYSSFRAARFVYDDASVPQQPFAFRAEPFGPGHRDEWTWLKGRSRLSGVVNHAHPFVDRLVRLHKARPGLAAFLMLKSMLLQLDGEYHPDAESPDSNLSEKAEGRLLAAALKLDGEAA